MVYQGLMQPFPKETKMKSLIAAFTLAVLLANPAAAIIYQDIVKSHVSTQGHVEDSTHRTRAIKDRG